MTSRKRGLNHPERHRRRRDVEPHARTHRRCHDVGHLVPHKVFDDRRVCRRVAKRNHFHNDDALPDCGNFLVLPLDEPVEGHIGTGRKAAEHCQPILDIDKAISVQSWLGLSD